MARSGRKPIGLDERPDESEDPMIQRTSSAPGRRRRRLGTRALVRAAVVVAGLLVFWVVTAVVLFALPHGDAPIHADAVFVLSGSPTRLPVGIRLVREGYAPLLVVDRTRPNPTALERRACSHKLGVPILCVRAEPYSTIGEAETLARLATARGWQRVDIVTSEYHVLRARLLFRRCFHGRLDVVGAPNQLGLLPVNAAFESVKLVYHEVVHRGC